MQRRITRYNHSAERPIPAFRQQFRANRICQHIETNSCECTVFTLVLTQNVVVGLVLEFVRLEHGAQLAAEKSHCIELVAFASHSHPDKVQVVGHEAIGWTPNLFTKSRVQHELSKTQMKQLVQPTRGAMLHRQRPHDNRVTLVMMAKQPRQIVPLFNRPVHCHRSRVCENAESLPRLIVRPRFHKRGYTSNRVFTYTATRAFSISRPRPVS